MKAANMSDEDKLLKLRDSIDALDSQLLDLINKRASYAQKVAIVKESLKENRSVRAICERKFSDFVHGLGILNQRTGKKEFIIDKKVVDDPDKELSQWVVESFGKQQDS